MVYGVQEFVQIETQKAKTHDPELCKVITVVNNKGGCGKTAITDALANYLFEHRYNVLVIDADPQANLSQRFGRYSGNTENVDHTLAELFAVIYKRLNVATFAGIPIGVRKSDEPNPVNRNYLSLLVGDRTTEFKVAGAIEECGGRSACISKFQKVICAYKKMYDFIIFDTAPAIKIGMDDSQSGRVNDFALSVSDWLVIPFDGTEAVMGIQRIMDWVTINHEKRNIKMPNALFVLSKYQDDIVSVSERVHKILVSMRLQEPGIRVDDEGQNFMYRVMKDKIGGNVCEHGIKELPTLKSKAYVGLRRDHKKIYDVVCNDILTAIQYGTLENICEKWGTYAPELDKYIYAADAGKRDGVSDNTFGFRYDDSDASDII